MPRVIDEDNIERAAAGRLALALKREWLAAFAGPVDQLTAKQRDYKVHFYSYFKEPVGRHASRSLAQRMADVGSLRQYEARSRWIFKKAKSPERNHLYVDAPTAQGKDGKVSLRKMGRFKEFYSEALPLWKEFKKLDAEFKHAITKNIYDFGRQLIKTHPYREALADRYSGKVKKSTVVIWRFLCEWCELYKEPGKRCCMQGRKRELKAARKQQE